MFVWWRDWKKLGPLLGSQAFGQKIEESIAVVVHGSVSQLHLRRVGFGPGIKSQTGRRSWLQLGLNDLSAQR